MIVTGDSFDVIFRRVCDNIVNNPEHTCSPRGSTIREALAVQLVLEDPTKRLINNPARDSNYGFAVGEFLWYWAARNDLQTMLYYNKRMGSFSDDGITLNSAYGHRLKSPVDMTVLSQWELAIETLVKDPDSRRAVMTIYSPWDMHRAVVDGSKDVPCTLSLQFFIRDEQLHLHVVMRSNDVMWGLTYDLFSFTLFQECMLLALQERGYRFLRLGRYFHTAGSMHIYDRHFELAERVAKWEKPDMSAWDPFAGMPHLTSLEDLGELVIDEQMLREGKIQSIDLGRYRGGELWMAKALNAHRVKRDSEKKEKP